MMTTSAKKFEINGVKVTTKDSFEQLQRLFEKLDRQSALIADLSAKVKSPKARNVTALESLEAGYRHDSNTNRLIKRDCNGFLKLLGTALAGESILRQNYEPIPPQDFLDAALSDLRSLGLLVELAPIVEA